MGFLDLFGGVLGGGVLGGGGKPPGVDAAAWGLLQSRFQMQFQQQQMAHHQQTEAERLLLAQGMANAYKPGSIIPLSSPFDLTVVDGRVFTKHATGITFDFGSPPARNFLREAEAELATLCPEATAEVAPVTDPWYRRLWLAFLIRCRNLLNWLSPGV